MNTPRHVGFSVDGNRRWSRSNGFTDVNEGHRIGALKVENAIAWCRQEGIETATFHLMSAENFLRPIGELAPLLHIIERLVEKISYSDSIRELRILGNLSLMRDETSSIFTSAMQRNSGVQGGQRINLLVGYDGHMEITKAFRAAVIDHKKAAPAMPIEALVDAITPDDIRQYLDTHGLTDPDLIIRTGGEQRLSGFLPWQSTYSELYFTSVLWPDIQYSDFRSALDSYQVRSRRYGR